MNSQHLHTNSKGYFVPKHWHGLTNANQIQILYALSINAHLKLSIPPTQHEFLALISIN